MPRKYHRPPAVKRRKPKKTNIPYTIPEETAADSGSAVATAEAPETEATPAVTPAVDGAREAAGSSREAPVKHIARDHSYVRAEVVRILVIGGGVLAILLLIAVLR